MAKQLSESLTAIIKEGTSDPSTQCPGLVLQVVNSDGVVLNSTASGYRSLETKEPMTEDSTFWIASCTKMVTAIALMQLYEEGHAPLDDADRLEEVCPELKTVQIMENGQLRDKKNRITLRMLMTHTAGFAYSFFSEDIWDKHFGKSGDKDEFAGGDGFLSQPLIFEPGTNRMYAIGIDWVGVYVERVSKKSLGEYFEENIFKPLQMKSTAFVLKGDMADRIVTMHQRSPDFSKVTPNKQHIYKPANKSYDAESKTFQSGGGGLISTADDYTKIIATLLNDGLDPINGARILKHETVDLMFTNQLADWEEKYSKDGFPVCREDLAQSYLRQGIPKAGPEGWGLNFQLYGDERFAESAKKEGTLFHRGSAPGLSNCFWGLDREKGIGGIILSQVLPFGDPAVFGVWNKVQETMYGAKSTKAEKKSGGDDEGEDGKEEKKEEKKEE